MYLLTSQSKHLLGLALLCLSAALPAAEIVLYPSANFAAKLQEAIQAAAPLDTIRLMPGVFRLEKGITVSNPRVRIGGSGTDRTIVLLPSDEIVSIGLHITADGVVMSDMTIEDAPSSALGVTGSASVVIQNIIFRWRSNVLGARGIEVNTSSDIQIHKVEIANAQNAGIYVAQSGRVQLSHIDVRGAEIGAHIHNSRAIEISESHFEDNGTGLLFSQDVEQTPAEKIFTEGFLIRNNSFLNNNSRKHRGQNTIPWPVGSAILIYGAQDMDIWNNDIVNHGSLGIGVFANALPSGQYIYPHAISIFDNQYESNANFPDLAVLRAELLASDAMLGDIVWDGRRPFAELMHFTPQEQVLSLAGLQKTSYINLDMDWYDLARFLHNPERMEGPQIGEIRRRTPLVFPALLQ